MSETPAPTHVILVDDDVLVTRALTNLLAEERRFVVHPFNDPLAAVQFLEANAVEVVVADYVMPELDGLSFLKMVRQLRPTASRVLLTGYADKDAAIRAINEVGLYHFIEKPWHNDEFLLILRNAAERARLFADLEQKTLDMNAFREKLFRALL